MSPGHGLMRFGLAAAAAFLLAGCDDGDAGGGEPTPTPACEEGARRCDGVELQRCTQEEWTTETDCSAVGGGCGVGSCVAAEGCVVTPVADETACDDGDPCTVGERCNAGSCTGSAKDCGDALDCTADGCDPATGLCTHDATGCGCATDADCDDADACTGVERCDPATRSCVAGTPVDCAGEADGCNTAACVPSDGSCALTPRADGTSCDDASPCTSADVCTAGSCAGLAVACDDGIACTVDACDPSDGACLHDGAACGCATDADCDDGSACTGAERCDPATRACLPGTPVDCMPFGSTCATATCDPLDGSCDLAPSREGEACDDADPCTATDLCAGGNCVGTGQLLCDDGIACTSDACLAGTGCVFMPQDVLCEDGGCTVDRCDAGLGCTHVPDDALCDDGLGCTIDRCDPLGACSSTPVPPQLTCAGVCFDPATPAPPGCALTNGSFETGDFSGWSAKDLAQPYAPLRVAAAGTPWEATSSAPTDGGFSALNGFDGCGPDTFELAQPLEVPRGGPVTLRFDYRASWNNGGTLPRVFRLQLEPAAGGPPLASWDLLRAEGGTFEPVSPVVTGRVDLEPFAGQQVIVRFVWEIPECFTGPAGFELDDVRLELGCDRSCAGVCYDGAPSVPPECQVRNGSFETGDLGEWLAVDMTSPYWSLAVVATGTTGPMVDSTPAFVSFVTAATDGGFSALNGFDGGGPDQVELSQELLLPGAGAVALAFDWRCGWNMLDYPGSTLPRTFRLDVEPPGGGAALLSTTLLTADPGTELLDTGPQTSSVDLTPLGDQTVRLHFVWDVPQPSTGPGACELDAVRVVTP